MAVAVQLVAFQLVIDVKNVIFFIILLKIRFL